MSGGSACHGAPPLAAPEASDRAGPRPGGGEAWIWTTLRLRSPVFVPLVAISLIGLAASLALRPAIGWALESRGEAAVRGVASYVWLAAALSPGFALLKAGVLAALGWALATLSAREVPVRPLFSLLLVGQAIIALRDVLSVAAIYLRGPTGIRGPEDLVVPLGLDALFPELGPAGTAVAGTCGPCDFLWAGFLALGLRRVLGLPRGAAVIGSLALWGARVAFAVLRARFVA